MKQQSIEVYINELMNYKKNKNNWDGKIKRKENKKLYAWYKEIINGRRKIDLDIKFRLTEIGLDLDGIVTEYKKQDFKTWLIVLEDYLCCNYYYGIKNNLRTDEKQILVHLGLKLKSSISKRLTFDEWLEILNEFKQENGGNDWNGIVSTKIKSYKNRNLYGFINSLRDKKLTQEQIEKIKKIGLKNKLTRK